MKKQNVSVSMFLFAVFLLLSSCGIFSLHPLYHEDDLIYTDNLIGTWLNSEDHKTVIVIDSLQNTNEYSFILIDGSDTVSFKMGLIKLKDQYFIDLFPNDDCNLHGGNDDCLALENLFRNYIPAHSFMKFDFNEQGFALTEFDSDRLLKLFRENKIRLAHEIPGDKEDDDAYVVITASTDDLQKFITRYAYDKDAFEETENYHRLY
jgi:hypothetical protein